MIQDPSTLWKNFIDFYALILFSLKEILLWNDIYFQKF